ncbi:MAG TPA: hypothetical protein VMV80_01170 [Anaerolineales bacterium]|nr:hypothetical protein [Anaerolineales bacterium]
MTTQTEIVNSKQPVQTPLPIKISILPLVLAVLVILSIVGAAIVIMPTRAEDLNSSRRALAATSARYQYSADQYAAMRQADSQRALESISARYQGLADLQAANSPVDAQIALAATSARYQYSADQYAAMRQADSQKALESISARYQGLADLLQAGEK